MANHKWPNHRPQITKSQITKSQITKSQITKSHIAKSQITEGAGGLQVPQGLLGSLAQSFRQESHQIHSRCCRRLFPEAVAVLLQADVLVVVRKGIVGVEVLIVPLWLQGWHSFAEASCEVAGMAQPLACDRRRCLPSASACICMRASNCVSTLFARSLCSVFGRLWSVSRMLFSSSAASTILPALDAREFRTISVRHKALSSCSDAM
eukprot:scaffold7052_cov254-Pinguiococcus_pyrenoidosus.AAC.84